MPNPTYSSCAECGRDFVTTEARKMFCSEECIDKLLSSTGLDIRKCKHGKPTAFCSACNEEG